MCNLCAKTKCRKSVCKALFFLRKKVHHPAAVFGWMYAELPASISDCQSTTSTHCCKSNVFFKWSFLVLFWSCFGWSCFGCFESDHHLNYEWRWNEALKKIHWTCLAPIVKIYDTLACRKVSVQPLLMMPNNDGSACESWLFWMLRAVWHLNEVRTKLTW